ncbi:receptor-type tyrosine-protein phosphatase N2 [Rhincodon typus]|uniref:receptor-type tyrosine-protein phosphatase N2 n=1 Tax=Rhincodon typus TaxID=259920 RepID=UPI0020305206|nr:receptor-type tyrosine-protein phosphatase N2 [Rhincodon typus]
MRSSRPTREGDIISVDGIFGRCQLVTVIDVDKYEVSPADLQRLQTILQELSLRGTQQIRRATQEKVASEEDYEGTDHGDLQGFNSFHQYLQLLRAFSQPANPMTSHKSRTDKSETAQSSPFLDDFLQSNREKSPSSHFLAFHHQFPDNKQAQPGPLRLLKQERSKLQAQGHAPVSEPIDKKQLIPLLESYLTQKLAVQAAMTGNDPDVRLKEALGSLRSKQQEGPNKDSQGGYMRIEALHPKVDDRLPEVKEEKVLHKSSAGKINGNNLLSNVDENFIHSVVQQLGTQHVNLDSLTSKQLDELSDVIAGALQVVDDETTHDGSRNSFEIEQELRQKEEEKAMKRTELNLGTIMLLPGFWCLADCNVQKLTRTNVKCSSMMCCNLIEEIPKGRVSPVPLGWTVSGAAAGAEQAKGEPVDLRVLVGNPEAFVNKSAQARCSLVIPTVGFAGVEVRSMLGPAVIFQVKAIGENVSTADVVNIAEINKEKLEKETGLKILSTGMREKSKLLAFPQQANEEDSTKFIILTIISIVCIIGVLIASGVIYCLRHRSHEKLKAKLGTLGHDATTSSDATNAYQELCRQRMAVKTSERPEPTHASRINSVSSQFSDGPQPSPSTRSSTSSWCEEPVQSNMDISTGHMILSYMEDHLRNKNRLEKEWEALAAYQAEPNTSSIAEREENEKKNRSQLVVPYDHSRITLKVESSHSNSDYINASPIMDHDPRNPAYIAAQGPLPATVADFWQMVWENGCVVIVMLTPLTENGVKQCYHYWPDEGSNLYHIYEVNLVSEHIWCEDFLVRSFYLKNLQTNETRTVTQFHFLSWFDQAVPSSTRILLDFRRKVNKCYRGRSCPIIVHCSDGAGRCGTYILIDMVLNRMAKGAKEIDIAATLEHLRDQRPMMVQTKDQFEFALTAVAEEVNAILKALPQ